MFCCQMTIPGSIKLCCFIKKASPLLLVLNCIEKLPLLCWFRPSTLSLLHPSALPFFKSFIRRDLSKCAFLRTKYGQSGLCRSQMKRKWYLYRSNRTVFVLSMLSTAKWCLYRPIQIDSVESSLMRFSYDIITIIIKSKLSKYEIHKKRK